MSVIEDDSVYECKPHIVSFNEIKQAVERNLDAVIHTPLCEAKLSKYMDYDIYLKCENLQYTGSCAERGMRNAFMANREDMMNRGVIVPSNGNTALAAAYHGNSLSIHVTVVMPERTPTASSQRCVELGSDVILYGETTDDAIQYARKINSDFNQFLISSDDPEVIAGLGTVGIEIVTQLPEVDAVIVPVGSGSLLAGTIIACKKLKCSCLVYGAECAKVPTMMKSLQAGKPVKVTQVTNLAQGLNASVVGNNAFATIKGRLDRMLLVDESYIAKAIISMLERERLVVDGAGVCALAAVMQGLVPELRGKRTVCILSGGNIDSGLLARTIQRGLGASGRLLRFAVPIPDQRSGLEQVANVLSDENAVLKSLVTEQIESLQLCTGLPDESLYPLLKSALKSVVCLKDLNEQGTVPLIFILRGNFVVEVANAEHSLRLKDRIQELYPSARFAITNVDQHKKNL